MLNYLSGDLVGVGESNKRKADDDSEGGTDGAVGGGGGTGGSSVTTAAAAASAAPAAKKPKMSAADIKSLPTRQYLDQVCIMSLAAGNRCCWRD